MSERLRFALVSDQHFGPNNSFRGKLRKMGDFAPALTAEIVQTLNNDTKPDFVVQLGDAIQDVDLETDRRNLSRCVDALGAFRGEVFHVAGNHDLAHLSPKDIAQCWGVTGPLYYSFERKGYKLIVLQTEQPELRRIQIAPGQLQWLERELQTGDGPAIVFMHHSASEQDVSDSRWFAGLPEAALLGGRKQFRELLERSGRVCAVFNGHLHRNRVDVIGGIPYVTVQSMTENVNDNVPAVASGAWTLVEVTGSSVDIEVFGNDPLKHSVSLTSRGAVAPHS